jgi:mRNA-capping enzyme
MIFAYAKSKKVKIGLWFDLTKTERYYNKNIVEEHDCKYVKLPCQGREGAPDVATVDLFLKICKAYIQQNPKEIIGVHCTHGFNRTGFMIVSYLVNELDWSVEAAVNEFSKAR